MLVQLEVEERRRPNEPTAGWSHRQTDVLMAALTVGASPRARLAHN